MPVSDRFTVVIQGRVAAEFALGDKTREEVLNLMAGGAKITELEEELGAVE